MRFQRQARSCEHAPLLVCGIVASLLYGAMIWVIRYDGYRPISQTVSELSAWGISTRPLWMVLGTIYEALMIAFALGVWASAGEKRSLRIASSFSGLWCWLSF